MNVFLLFCGILLGFSQGCTSAELAWMRETTGIMAPPVSVDAGRMMNVAKTERGCDWGIASHPFLALYPGNRIGISFNVKGDGAINTGYAEVSYPFYSDDGGETWVHGNPNFKLGEPGHDKGILTQGKSNDKVDVPSIHHGPCRLPSGMITSPGFIATAAAATNFYTRPDGRLVSEGISIRMPSLGHQSFEMHFQDAAVDKDGSIYAVAYASAPPSRRKGSETLLFVSHDSGSHYDFVSIVASPEDVPDSSEGADEPAIVILPDGEILVVMRTGGHVPRVMLAARSNDKGLTWKKTDMPMIGVMPKLVLMSNGVLALATGRPGNHLYFSVDGGHEWSRHVVVSDRASSGYIDIMEVSPGRLLAVFDLFNVPDPTVTFGASPSVCGIYAQHFDITYNRD